MAAAGSCSIALATLIVVAVPWMSAAAPEKADGMPDQPSAPPLDSYETTSRVWLGSILGEVKVNPAKELNLNRPGELHWLVEGGTSVVEGDVIALTAHEKITFSERQLELKQRRHRRELEDIRWDAEEKIKAVNGSIIEQEELLKKVTLTTTEREVLGEKFETRMREQRESIEREIEKLRERLTSGYFEDIEQLDLQAKELELEGAELDHEELIRNSQLLAPTNGTLKILKRGNIIQPGVVGEVVKIGLAEVEVELSDPRLRSIAGEEMIAEIPGDDGKEYLGRYLREAERQGFNQANRTIVLEIFSPQEGEPVSERLSGSRLVTIYRILERSGYMVPKTPLVFDFPEEIGNVGWLQFVTDRWPGSEIIYIGPREIIVAPPNED